MLFHTNETQLFVAGKFNGQEPQIFVDSGVLEQEYRLLSFQRNLLPSP
jgi:hypothetical protein